MTITGAFAGAGIQYVIPATLVWLARRKLAQLEGEVRLAIIILIKLMLISVLALMMMTQTAEPVHPAEEEQ